MSKRVYVYVRHRYFIVSMRACAATFTLHRRDRGKRKMMIRKEKKARI